MHFSPSVFHRHLMDNTEQILAYRGGDMVAWKRRLRRKLRGRHD